MRQLGLAELDLALHMDYDPDTAEPPDAFARGILAPFGAAGVADDDAMVASFGHVFGHPIGYACGYYAYRWADVLAADVFSKFEAKGVLDRELGVAVREELLAVGNHRAPADSFAALMGRAPRIEPLLRREGLA
jgi:oligopeptidase A